MAQGPGEDVMCAECGKKAARVFSPVVDVWHCDGAHKTDYFSGHGGIGTRAEQLRRKYERVTGEKAPPPARDVPRNARDIA